MGVLCLSIAEGNIFARPYGSVSPWSLYPSPISAYRSPIFRNPSIMSAPWSKYPSPASLFSVSGIPSLATGCDITACIVPLIELESKANISLKFVATDPTLKADICRNLEISKKCVKGLMTTCMTGVTKVTLLKEILNLGINRICTDEFLSEIACWEHPEFDVIHDKCLVSTLAPATSIKYPGCTIGDFPIVPSFGAANLPMMSRLAMSKYY